MKKIFTMRFLFILDILLALGAVFAWSLQGKDALTLAGIGTAVFIAAFPLPWLLSAPFARYLAKKGAADLGIKIASSKVIKKIQYINTLVLSKFGMLTRGEPHITDIVPEGMSQPSLLALAGTIEQESVHPIGRIIYKTALERGARIQRLAAFSESPATGAEAIMSGTHIRAGMAPWLKKEKVEISARLLTMGDKIAHKGKTVVFISSGKYARGFIALEDEISTDTISALHRLQHFGLKIHLLTGDAKGTALGTQKSTGIDEITARLTPEQKAREIKLMRTRGEIVAMIGDMDEDKIPLQEADIKIEIAAKQKKNSSNTTKNDNTPKKNVANGEETAEELPQTPPETKLVPDIILPNRILDLLPVIRLARKVSEIEHSNHYIALIAFIVLVPLAFGLLVPFGGDFLRPDFAFYGMALASIIVLINSLRLSSTPEHEGQHLIEEEDK